MRKAALLVATTIAAAAAAAPAGADPSHNIAEPTLLTCSDGTSVLVNPGTVTNQSHQAFVIGSSSIMVVNRLAFTNGPDTFVIFDTAPGLNSQGLVTCSGDAGGGFTIMTRGFFTPRA
jgi:hypothetical protein